MVFGFFLSQMINLQMGASSALHNSECKAPIGQTVGPRFLAEASEKFFLVCIVFSPGPTICTGDLFVRSTLK